MGYDQLLKRIWGLKSLKSYTSGFDEFCQTVIHVIDKVFEIDKSNLRDPIMNGDHCFIIQKTYGIVKYEVDTATWPFLKNDMQHGAYRH